MSLREVLNRKFVNVEEVANIVEIGVKSKKNVFLYGRGGHAKSEIAEEVLKYLDASGENSFVQACGEGLTEEKLFGGMNLAKFQKTGEIEYLVENSFMNKKFVVFEELLDSRMSVLLSLKDILTSGKFRQGKQQFTIKTEFILCLTNRTKQEVAEDNSIKALLERFPLEYKVEWNRYENADYSAMFQKVLSSDFSEVANICHAINESGDFVSPRTAIHMAQVYKSTGNIGNLRYFGATSEIIDKMQKIKKEAEDARFLANTLASYNTVYGSVDFSDMNSMKNTLRTLRTLKDVMEGKSYSDTNHPTFVNINQHVAQGIEQIRSSMINIIENE